jgi:hypothetical protein
MSLTRKMVAIGLAGCMTAVTFVTASAREGHHHGHYAHRHYYHHRYYGGGPGAALGLLGAGIAGAIASDRYGYGYPAYGYRYGYPEYAYPAYGYSYPPFGFGGEDDEDEDE